MVNNLWSTIYGQSFMVNRLWSVVLVDRLWSTAVVLTSVNSWGGIILLCNRILEFIDEIVALIELVDVIIPHCIC